MKILALDLGADWRGGQRQTFLAITGLVERGHAVTLLARRGAPLARESADSGIAVIEAPPGGEASPRLLVAIARAAARLDPDVLYAGDGRGHGAAVWSGGAFRRPLVVHRRVAFPPGRDPLSRLKYLVPRRYLAVSGAVRDALVAVGVSPARVVVLADGLPREAFLESKTDHGPPWRLAHVGAFNGRKGQEIAVGVVAKLVAGGRDVTALFLGDGPARGSVEALAASSGVTERCTFAGMVADVSERLAECHALLLPSQSEGAALAVAEAMAAGCVVVAHDVGGTAEMLADGSAGRLLPDLDEERWASAVAELIDAPERRAALIAAGRTAASERTLERTIATIERELLRAVGNE